MFYSQNNFCIFHIVQFCWFICFIFTGKIQLFWKVKENLDLHLDFWLADSSSGPCNPPLPVLGSTPCAMLSPQVWRDGHLASNQLNTTVCLQVCDSSHIGFSILVGVPPSLSPFPPFSPSSLHPSLALTLLLAWRKEAVMENNPPWQESGGGSWGWRWSLASSPGDTEAQPDNQEELCGQSGLGSDPSPIKLRMRTQVIRHLDYSLPKTAQRLQLTCAWILFITEALTTL